jgi:hypothetical protein
LEKEIAQLRRKLQEHEERISSLENIVKKKPRENPSERKGVEDMLVELKTSGFFTEGKTIAQILDALHAKGRIVKMTALPKYLLTLVRNDTLKREQRLVGKRNIWVYSA